jgi:hypothetical protein
MKNSWREFWELSSEDNKLYEVKKTTEKWTDINKLNRKDATLITRLRIGHTRFTHGHLFDSDEKAPQCDCGEVTTVKHIFLCKKTEKLREAFGINEFYDIGIDNYEKMKKVIEYIKKIGLYFEI